MKKLNIDYDQINSELEKEFGKGVVIFERASWGGDPYVLHFENGNVPQSIIDRAIKVMELILPEIEWKRDNSKIV